MVDQNFGFSGANNSMSAQSSLKTKLNQLEVSVVVIAIGSALLSLIHAGHGSQC